MTDLGPITHYFGLCIIRNLDVSTMFFIQETYIQKILDCFEIYENAKEVDTSIVKKKNLIYAISSY